MDAHLGKATLSKSFYLPSEKGDYTKRTEFAPFRSKFFPFRVDPFSEGSWSPNRKANRNSQKLPAL